MTMPDERTRAVIKTQRLLLALLQTPVSKWNKKEIRKQVASCLRHYPSAFDFSAQDLDSFDFGNHIKYNELNEDVAAFIKLISKEIKK